MLAALFLEDLAMKNLLIGLSAALASLSAATMASANIGLYIGNWVNVDPNTRGVTRIVIRRAGGAVRLGAFGQCHPTDCDWGTVNALPYGPSVTTNPLAQTRALLARFAPAHARILMLVERVSGARLRAKVLTRFVDASGRRNYVRTYLFRKGRPPFREDCVSFNPATTRVVRVGTNWKLVDGAHQMKAFGGKVAEARRALTIIRHYRLNRLCFVGRPNPSMEYWKRNNNLPVGALPGEDCLRIDPSRARVSNVGGNWTIVQGSHLIKAFPNRGEARIGLAIMRRHNARFSCFVGRPGPSMTYLRR